jgi:hypothetical protein
MVMPTYVVATTNQPTAFTPQNQNNRFRKGKLQPFAFSDEVYRFRRFGVGLPYLLLRLLQASAFMCHLLRASGILLSYLKGRGFGGVVVSMPASGTQDRVFEPRPKPSDFSGEKIHSMPSFGGEVKPSVPFRRFAACKRTL